MSALAGRRLYIIAYCTVAAALVWLIVSTAAAGQFAARDPAFALRWRSGDPQALTQLAQDSLGARNLPRARSYAREALVHSPHEATAWRLLGEIALASSDAPLAKRLFAQAGTLTHRDAALAARFFEDAVRDQRYVDAVRYADVVMRRAPDKQSALVFRLAALARDPVAAGAIARTVAGEPSWRRAFFRELAGGGASDAGIMQLLDMLAAQHTPLRPDEMSPLLTRLVKDGHTQEARRLWLASLPAHGRVAGLVYDPTFKGPAAPAPFGWTFDSGSDARTRLASPGEQPGLHVTLEGINAHRLALQTLVLQPGRYRFDTTARLMEGDSASLTWIAGCPGQLPVRLDMMGSAPATASTEFTVGPDCPTQVLMLRADARDHAAPARVLVERAAVERIG